MLPELRVKLPACQALIHSVQGHGQGGSNWLLTLCNTTNINKHARLTEQQMTVKREFSVAGGMFRMIDSSGTMENCSFNGVRMGQPEPALIHSDMTDAELAFHFPNLGAVSTVHGQAFKIDSTDWDVLKLLTLARGEEWKLADAMFSELGA